MREPRGHSASRAAMARWMRTAPSSASTTLAELDQQAVAHGLDDAPAMLAQRRVDEFASRCWCMRAMVPVSSTSMRRE